jgi:hypothetical protein
MPSKQGQSLLRILFFLSDLGIHISDISLGALHVVGLSTLGNIYTWGYNANGQLGTWDTLNRAYPVRVKKREPVSYVVCTHSLTQTYTDPRIHIYTHTHTHTGHAFCLGRGGRGLPLACRLGPRGLVLFRVQPQRAGKNSET